MDESYFGRKRKDGRGRAVKNKIPVFGILIRKINSKVMIVLYRWNKLRNYHDKNGWIDENDTIFNDLKVWAKKRDGKDILYNLKDLNIGAIYLSNLSIEFDMNNDTNETLGIAKKVGIFLKENGKTSTIMHIDIKI